MYTITQLDYACWGLIKPKLRFLFGDANKAKQHLEGPIFVTLWVEMLQSLSSEYISHCLQNIAVTVCRHCSSLHCKSKHYTVYIEDTLGISLEILCTMYVFMANSGKNDKFRFINRLKTEDLFKGISLFHTKH